MGSESRAVGRGSLDQAFDSPTPELCSELGSCRDTLRLTAHLPLTPTLKSGNSVCPWWMRLVTHAELLWVPEETFCSGSECLIPSRSEASHPSLGVCAIKR